jgi:hypothetical protein
MTDDVGAPLERPAQIGRRQGVVDDQRDSGRVRDLRDLLDIDNDAAGIGEVLDKDRLALRGQRAAEILRIGWVDKMAFPAEHLERQAELGQRAAIEVARGDEFVARLQQREKNQELRGMARCRRDRGATAFEAGDALFEHRPVGLVRRE